MNIPDSQIAVTLFNLRDYCKNESDLDRTLAKVRAIGYRAVQVSGTPVDYAIIHKLLQKNDLYCCATHENIESLSNVPRLIERMQELDCDFAALGCPTPGYRDEDGFVRLAAFMEETAGKLLAHGIRLGYHNHNFEFQHGADGMSFLEKFYSLTSPEKVCAELDVHWIARGGGNPSAWIRRMNGRMSVIHFKDYAVVGPDAVPAFCEIGEGNLDWPDILRACRETGVRWYSIEQDQTFGGRDIFESIALSFRNLTAMGVK